MNMSGFFQGRRAFHARTTRVARSFRSARYLGTVRYVENVSKPSCLFTMRSVYVAPSPRPSPRVQVRVLYQPGAHFGIVSTTPSIFPATPTTDTHRFRTMEPPACRFHFLLSGRCGKSQMLYMHEAVSVLSHLLVSWACAIHQSIQRCAYLLFPTAGATSTANFSYMISNG